MQGSGQIIFNQPHNQSTDQQEVTGDATQDDIQKTTEKDPQKAAQLEVAKESAKKEISSQQKLDEIVHKVSEVLFSTTTVFPFVLFPIKIIVRPDKVDVIYQTFFFSEHIHSTMIEDITDVTTQTSLFFGTFVMSDKGFHDKTISISYLSKSDAMKLRRLVQGLIIAKKEGIDPTKIDKQTLLDRLDKIGQAHEV